MEFCFSSPGKSKTLAALTQMLSSSADDDACMLLAYGYLGSSQDMRDAIAAWFQKKPGRKICLFVGLLEHRKVSTYLTAKNQEITLEPYTASSLDVSRRILAYLKFYFEPIGEYLRLDENLFVFVIPGFHGKLSALLAQVVDVNYPDRSATTILAGGSGE